MYFKIHLAMLDMDQSGDIFGLVMLLMIFH